MASLAGDHTARKGEIQRPVLLLCFMTGPGAKPFFASHTRSVLSRLVLTMRCEPAAKDVGFIRPLTVDVFEGMLLEVLTMRCKPAMPLNKLRM